MNIGQSIQTRYVPREELLCTLRDGWRFWGDIAEPMRSHHGRYSCLMWRECDAD